MAKLDIKSPLSKRAISIAPSLTLAITSKAKQMKADGIDVISFGAGEPDFDTPEFIKQAAVKALNSGATKYTPAIGTLELRNAITKKLERENGLQYTADQIVVSCGAKHSIHNVIQALVDAEDEVLIPAPYWLSYPEMVTLAGGKSVIIPTTDEESFKITADKLKQYITPKSKVLILNSPSNPTGAVYSKEELQAIGEVVKKHGIFTISDEIYETLLYDGREHYSFAKIDDEIKDLTITVNGHSKRFAMTGWRIGYVACRKDIAKAISGMQSHTTSNPTSFAQAGALAALTESDESGKKMFESFSRRRDLIVKEIDSIEKMTYFKPQGAFYIFCNISQTGLTSLDFCDQILTEQKVACVPGVAFGSDNHIRLSFAIADDKIVEGIKRIRQFIESR